MEISCDYSFDIMHTGATLSTRSDNC